MRLPPDPEVPAQINIVPMIDVIFAILTFFIMSSLFLNRSEGLPVNLPKAATATVQQSTKATVTLDAQNQIYLNRKLTPLSSLAPAVRQLIQPNASLVVVINADRKVEHGQVVEVMDQLRQIPGVKLAIATQRP